jgi:transcriptional regulator with XRE-family HTH domain
MSESLVSVAQEIKQPAGLREIDLGARLRTARELFGLSQRELARLSGVTNGTISMIEQNQTSPSVGSLKKLTDALSLTLAEFFSLDWRRPAGPFFKRAVLREIGGGTVLLHMVPAGVPDPKLQVLREVYPPGGDTGPDLLSHPGEEAGVVVRGAVSVTVGGQEKVLRAGDAYYFNSRIPHRFRNLGDEECEIISSATPRSF